MARLDTNKDPKGAPIPDTSDVLEVTQVARVLLLIKENQLATAAVLFFAWQAGVFIEAWAAVQGMCGA